MDSIRNLPFERRSESAARVGASEGQHYYTVDFFGGRAASLLQRLERMKSMILQDREAGVEAMWGLESYLNRDLVDFPPDQVFPARFVDYFGAEEAEGVEPGLVGV